MSTESAVWGAVGRQEGTPKSDPAGRGKGCLETEQTSACWREEAGVQAEAVREEAGST